jgi:hypothetical protein
MHRRDAENAQRFRREEEEPENSLANFSALALRHLGVSAVKKRSHSSENRYKELRLLRRFVHLRDFPIHTAFDAFFNGNDLIQFWHKFLWAKA